MQHLSNENFIPAEIITTKFTWYLLLFNSQSFYTSFYF